MALQGDLSGVVTIPRWTASGDFSLSGKFTYTAGTHAILGDDAGNLNKLTCQSSGNVDFTASNNYRLGGFSEGEIITWSFTRVGSTGTFTANGATKLAAISGSFTIDSLGQFNGGGFKYGGQWQDSLIMTGGDGGDDRSYDFNQPEGSTNLPDSVSGNDGTLSGFTTGGFVGGVGDSISITSHANWDCIQRDVNNQAVFTIAGDVSGGTVVEYELDSSGVWLVLDNAATTTFSGSVTITGQQRIEVRLQANTSIVAFIDNLSASMNVPCWWQSNMAGFLTNPQTITVIGENPIPVMYKEGVFSQMQDPTAPSRSGGGSLVPLIAQYYSDQGIAVCFGNVAITNTKLDAWLSATPNYQLMTDFHNDCGGFEFSLSIGGEADTQANTPQATMESQLNSMVNSLNADFGVEHKLVYFPIGDSLNGDYASIRLAFDSVISSNNNCSFAGDLSVIDIDIATTPGNDGIHIKSDADATTASQIIYSALTASTSTITITGIPDGTFLTTLITADRPSALIESVDRVYSGGSSTFSVNVPVGTQMYGVVRDNLDPSTDGAAINAVTV